MSEARTRKQELSELTDKELLKVVKKMKSSGVWSALAIGMMIGIIFYSIIVSSVSLFTLIPLYFAHKIFNNPENKKDIETARSLMKERNLKW